MEESRAFQIVAAETQNEWNNKYVSVHADQNDTQPPHTTQWIQPTFRALNRFQLHLSCLLAINSSDSSINGVVQHITLYLLNASIYLHAIYLHQ